MDKIDLFHQILWIWCIYSYIHLQILSQITGQYKSTLLESLHNTLHFCVRIRPDEGNIGGAKVQKAWPVGNEDQNLKTREDTGDPGSSEGTEGRCFLLRSWDQVSS